MRKLTDKKTETRERILDAASGLFRRHGVDAVGVDAVMRAAGLTHGGFYGHFPSKEALVGEVAAASLARAATRWEQILDQEGPGGLDTIVRSYLDPAHVSEVGRGCVLATMGADVSRRPGQRPAIEQSVRRMTEALEQGMAGRNHGDAPDRGADRSLAALATMVGAVMLARLADDPATAEAMLRAARHAVLGDSDADADART